MIRANLGGRDVILRSTEARGVISTNKYLPYSVSQNFIYPCKELCSKTASGEVGV